jgi:hypothetical protein
MRVASPEDGKTIMLEKIKRAISENKPVVVGMDIDNVPGKGAFKRLTRNYIWLPDRSVNPSPGHAMTIVSYNDDYGSGAFDCRTAGVEVGEMMDSFGSDTKIL